MGSDQGSVQFLGLGDLGFFPPPGGSGVRELGVLSCGCPQEPLLQLQSWTGVRAGSSSELGIPRKPAGADRSALRRLREPLWRPTEPLCS